MSLLDGDLQRLFGAAFEAVYLNATLAKGGTTDIGTGGFSVLDTTYPVKAMREALSDRARAASGLPDTAVTISVLRAGLTVALDLDDRVTLSGLVYRVTRVNDDPAAVAWSVVAVPVLAA